MTTGETVGIVVGMISIISPIVCVSYYSGQLTREVKSQGVTLDQHGDLLLSHGNRIARHDRRLDRIDERCGIHHDHVSGNGMSEEDS